MRSGPGPKFFCPCCESGSDSFHPFGSPARPNAQCPRCGSLERHRLLQLFLKEKTNFYKDRLKVFDVAPMPILQRQWSKLANLDYTSVDISSPRARLKMDITDIRLRDNLFDCVICYHVLEHVGDDRKAMRELFRILKPGGWAVIQSPVIFERETTFEDPNILLPDDRERVFGQADHVRIYGKDYAERLEAAGFKVKIDHFAKKLKDPLLKRYGLNNWDKIFFCTKPVAVKGKRRSYAQQ